MVGRSVRPERFQHLITETSKDIGIVGKHSHRERYEAGGLEFRWLVCDLSRTCWTHRVTTSKQHAEGLISDHIKVCGA